MAFQFACSKTTVILVSLTSTASRCTYIAACGTVIRGRHKADASSSTGPMLRSLHITPTSTASTLAPFGTLTTPATAALQAHPGGRLIIGTPVNWAKWLGWRKIIWSTTTAQILHVSMALLHQNAGITGISRFKNIISWEPAVTDRDADLLIKRDLRSLILSYKCLAPEDSTWVAEHCTESSSFAALHHEISWDFDIRSLLGKWHLMAKLDFCPLWSKLAR